MSGGGWGGERGGNAAGVILAMPQQKLRKIRFLLCEKAGWIHGTLPLVLLLLLLPLLLLLVLLFLLGPQNHTAPVYHSVRKWKKRFSINNEYKRLLYSGAE